MILSEMNKKIDSLNIERDIEIYVAENENEMFNKIPLNRVILVMDEDKPYLVLMGSKQLNFSYSLQNMPPLSTTIDTYY